MVLGLGVGVTAVFSDLLGGGTSADGMSTNQAWAMRLGPDTITPAQFQQELRFVSNEATRQGLTGAGFQAQVKFEAMQRLARRTLEVRAAREAGLTASDREVSDRVVSMPDFQRDGRFIGVAEYQRILDREGIDVTTFETRVRDGILCEKWENLVRAGAVVTESEIDDELAHRGEKVRFDFVVVGPDKFPASAAPTEAEIKSWYEANLDRYQRGEARRAKYVVLDTKEAEKQVTVSDDEVRKLYEANAEQFGGTFDTKKDEVRSQIAFTKALEETDRQAAVFKANIKSAADLDPAASKKSLTVVDTGLIRREDPAAAALGPELQSAIFGLTPGEAAGQARTTSGSAVFVVVDSKPAGRATLDEARGDVVSDLNKDKGRQAAMSAARSAVSAAGSDLGVVASKLGATVQSSPLVAKGEAIPSLGYEPAVESAAFAAAPNKIADPVATAGGSVVVLKVAEKSSPEPGANTAARDQVRTDLLRTREAELLQSIIESAYKKTEPEINEEYIRQFGS
jgi:peptidyl-prolyl cis-trans isomerase D